MANMLYNGVELPALPEWDVVNYPYALITVYTPSGATYLRCLRTEPTVQTQYGETFIAVLGWTVYKLSDDRSQWNLFAAPDYTASAKLTLETDGAKTTEVIWTNDDLESSDGSVYLAASTPIRADSKLKISVGGDSANGNGFALYNGVKLPNIDSVWDKTAYPYSALVYMNFDGQWASQLYCSSTPLVSDGEYFVAADGSKFSIDVYMCGVMDGADFSPQSWANYGKSEYYQFPGGSATWSSYDILNTDGSVYLAASDPVPVGGGSGDDEDDESTAEKHYCRINGTIYKVEGGTARMGGTFCEVKSGTVLIDGTVYDFALN